MGFRFSLVLLFVSMLSLTASAQKIQSTPYTTQLLDAFTTASKAYNVPVDLLKAVAYEQTRYSNIIESSTGKSTGDQPPVYGVMGLRNDDWFGHSLLEGSKLINQPPEVVAINPYLNVQAAATLISSIADSLNIDRTNLNNWRPVLEEFSGIPQKDIRPFFTFDVFKVLSDGSDLNGVNIPKYSEVNMNQFSPMVNPKSKQKAVNSIQNIQSDDYGPAVWSPSPNYYNDNNFNQLFCVVHDTEGPFASSLSWLQNPASSASAHYIIRSSDGYIVQMVREKYAAWHVVCWNRYMLGVEHEGYVSNPSYFTEAMYKASAGLFRHFIETYGIPLDSNHVIGHDQHLFPWWVNYINKNYPYIDPTCNSHTDPGKYWDWTHYFALIRSDATMPSLASHYPARSTDSVWSNSQVKLTFSIAMDPTQTQNAFTISPHVDGTFSWADDNHTIVFTPSALLSPSTDYKVSITQFAASILGVSLDSAYTFDFVTKPLSQLAVEDSYPANNQAGVSTTLKVLVKFNSPLVKSSLGGRIILQDSTGKNISIKNASYSELNNAGVVSFLPSSPLLEDATYKVIFKSGIQSINASQLNNDFVINFTTGKSNFVQGTTIDNFESIGSWTEPNSSSGSTGIDTVSSAFDIIYGTQADGQHSGRITYVFNGSQGGVCSIVDGAKPNIGSKQDNMFGMWVFGDASDNYLNLGFSTNTSQNISVRLDTLNWTGWKFIEIPFSSISASGDIFFTGISILQSPGGADSNMVFFDGAQYRDPAATGINDNNSAAVPGNFILEQNYPNPFNPGTVISYYIPQESYVTLKVYDMLGREVALLVSQNERQGAHQVEFNAAGQYKNLTSGIYFYTLKVGGFTDTKKMLLLK